MYKNKISFGLDFQKLHSKIFGDYIMKSKIPKIFIGSTIEGLELAELIQEQLMHNFEVQLWNQGIFKPGNSNLQNLINSLNKFDYAAFLFTFDDDTLIHNETYKTVRDNIIFEYGLFTGFLGRKKTWFIIDIDTDKKHLPTDLEGINPIEYKSNNRDLNTVAGIISTKIKHLVNEIELEPTDSTIENSKRYQQFKHEKKILLNNIYKKLNLNLNRENFYRCGIIALDLDGFEHISRVFGQVAANLIIDKVEQLIQWFLNRTLNENQYYFTRFYSDEFFIIIKDYLLTKNEIKLTLKDLSNAIVSEIKGYDWNHLIPNLYLSCSAGYANPNSTINERVEDCLSRALYATKIAKKLGGNSSCAAPEVHNPRIRSELYYECSDQQFYWKKRDNATDLDY